MLLQLIFKSLVFGRIQNVDLSNVQIIRNLKLMLIVKIISKDAELQVKVVAKAFLVLCFLIHIFVILIVLDILAYGIDHQTINRDLA